MEDGEPELRRPWSSLPFSSPLFPSPLLQPRRLAASVTRRQGRRGPGEPPPQPRRLAASVARRQGRRLAASQAPSARGCRSPADLRQLLEMTKKCVSNASTVENANTGMHVPFYFALLKSVLELLMKKLTGPAVRAAHVHGCGSAVPLGA